MDLEGEALDRVYRQAIALADAKKEVTDADLIALVESQAAAAGAADDAVADAPVRLEGWSVSSSKGGSSRGDVSLVVNGQAVSAQAEGNGPVDALFVAVDTAVEPLIGWFPRLTDYEIRAVSGGEDAQGRVMVRARRSIDPEGTAETVTGHGLSTNIIEASLEAYLAALEKLLWHEATSRRRPSRPGHGVASLRARRAASPTTSHASPATASAPRSWTPPCVVLEAAAERFGFGFAWTEVLAGGIAIDAYGTAIRDEDLDVLLAQDAVLLGAVGGPKWDDPAATVRPEQGLLRMRKVLGLFANLRPVAVEPSLVEASPLRPDLVAGVDLHDRARAHRRTSTSASAASRTTAPTAAQAYDTMIYSEPEVRRIVRLAFELARGRRKRLTSVDKANVLASSRLWRTVVEEVAPEFPDVELEHRLVDSTAMSLITKPASFDVIVTEQHVRRHPLGRGLRAGRLAGHAALGLARRAHARRTARPACTSPSTARRRPRPASTSPTPPPPSCRGP